MIILQIKMDSLEYYNIFDFKSKKKYPKRIHEKNDTKIKKQMIRDKKKLEKLIYKKHSTNSIRKYN